ncbi:MAG: ABC transporter ATP-binding protein [Gammaproteobacteria bacterium]
MSDEVLLAARGLRRAYGRITALSGVDVEIRRGEVLGFLGLNGAGKSTTMQILAGALAADAGTVTIAGHDLRRKPGAARAALGYLPQTPPLYDDMLVDEYLGFCAAIRGVARGARAGAVAAARGRCGLGDVGARLLRHLSQGYRQRVGIAQAIVHDPAVLILDEPTTGLDPAQIRDVRRLIAELAAGHAVMLSTHVLPEVRALASRVMILHEGRIVHDGPVDARQGHLRLRCGRPPPAAALRALPGVRAVNADGADGFLVDADAAAAPALAAAAVREGWDLLELTPDYDTLEQLFLRLTSGEPIERAA